MGEKGGYAGEFVKAAESHEKFKELMKLFKDHKEIEGKRFELDKKWAWHQRFLRAVDNIALAANLPRVADEKVLARYQRLLDAGVVIRTYEVSMMHAKVMTVDGTVASVGSANFNQRSLRHDDEANIVIFDPAVVQVLDEHLDEDLENTILLDPAQWADRGMLQRVAERVSETVNHWL